MSQFNVHEWNYKRRLAALNESNLQEVSDYIPEDEIDYSLYPKKGEPNVAPRALAPRVYIPEAMWSKASEVGAQPLYAPTKIGAKRGHPQYLEPENFMTRFLLVAFPDKGALKQFISTSGRIFFVGNVGKGSEYAKRSGNEKILKFGGLAAIDITDGL